MRDNNVEVEVEVEVRMFIIIIIIIIIIVITLPQGLSAFWHEGVLLPLSQKYSLDF